MVVLRFYDWKEMINGGVQDKEGGKGGDKLILVMPSHWWKLIVM